MCYISKILKNESNSQLAVAPTKSTACCVISQRYWKMKAIHNTSETDKDLKNVVLYLKDTEKWKQFTTFQQRKSEMNLLCYISKILKNESNSQHWTKCYVNWRRCVISQRYWKMKAIHNVSATLIVRPFVVLYLKDTEKWKQFTTNGKSSSSFVALCYISKILKNESNSQR